MAKNIFLYGVAMRISLIPEEIEIKYQKKRSEEKCMEKKRGRETEKVGGRKRREETILGN